MSAFDRDLSQRLRALEEQNLFRTLRRVSSPQQTRISVEGRELLNFSSNDYLGLATHPALKAAAAEASARFGTGSGASRLISGSLGPHHELEEALASFKGTEAALVFASGYATALGVIPALAGSGDIVIIDKLIHASIVDAARLSGAILRVFRHNDLDHLEHLLVWAAGRRAGSPASRVLIVTESVFSMDGDFAPLREITALKVKHGAWLMVDEAHATGLFGPRRRGLAEEAGVAGRIDVHMGTLGKALGSAGGYAAGSRVLIDYLVNKARPFIFSTAPPPAVSAAARAGIAVVQSDEGAALLARLRSNLQALSAAGLKAAAPGSPIVPWIIGGERETLGAAARLRDRGIFVPAIRYPSVGRGKARLRFTLSAAHTAADLGALSAALADAPESPADV